MVDLVRSTCQRVQTQARHVKISTDGISREATLPLPSLLPTAIKEFVLGFDRHKLEELCSRKHIDSSIHFSGDAELTAQYLLVLDAINFCFWPDHDLEYQHLSTGLKNAIVANRDILSAENLKRVEGRAFLYNKVLNDADLGKDIRQWLNWPQPLPLEEERARLIREVGQGLDQFEGRAVRLIEAANKSVGKLVSLLTAYFPGFRDHAVYHGEQVFLLKRAQIFAGDVWGSFGGTDLGEFHDIDQLTMFADYRVPQILQHRGILQYSEHLQGMIDAEQEIAPGSEMEIEIRACTVSAVEEMKSAFGKQFGQDLAPLSIQLDWWLWETAEHEEFQNPHHHTRTMFY